MNIFLYLTVFFTGLLVALIGIVIYKIVTKRELPDSYYTPFDYITAQTAVEFHEEKEEKEQEDDQGDDKDKTRFHDNPGRYIKACYDTRQKKWVHFIYK